MKTSVVALQHCEKARHGGSACHSSMGQGVVRQASPGARWPVSFA